MGILDRDTPLEMAVVPLAEHSRAIHIEGDRPSWGPSPSCNMLRCHERRGQCAPQYQRGFSPSDAHIRAPANAFAYRFAVPAPYADISAYASAFANGCAFTNPGSAFLRKTAGTLSGTHTSVESSLCWPVYPTAPAVDAAPTD